MNFLCIISCSFLTKVNRGTEKTCWFTGLYETALLTFIGNGSVWLILRGFIFQEGVLIVFWVSAYVSISSFLPIPKPLIFFSCEAIVLLLYLIFHGILTCALLSLPSASGFLIKISYLFFFQEKGYLCSIFNIFMLY